jgi:hypothetical protein
MANRVLGVVGSNGQAKRGRKLPVSGHTGPAVAGVAQSRLRTVLTVGMGCGIPALTLALSSVGGRLLEQGQYGLGSGALVLCCSVLAVSLSHLAWAIKDITGSHPWQAWALAVAVDVSLVLCELSRVAGFELWVVPAIMVGVTVASMVLNCWAFLRSAR